MSIRINNNNDAEYLTTKIFVQTYHGYINKWIQFRRGPIYKEYAPRNEIEEKNEDPMKGFQLVKDRKKHKPTYIYYWYLHAHNLYPFDILKLDGECGKIVKPWSKFKKYTLYFCEPDSHIYQNDSFPQSGLDTTKAEPVPLLFYAKYNGIKFKPITFIARTEDQIKESLLHIKYCVVKEVGLDKLQIVSEDDIRNEYLQDNPPAI